MIEPTFEWLSQLFGLPFLEYRVLSMVDAFTSERLALETAAG